MENDFIEVEVSKDEFCLVRKAAISYVQKRAGNTSAIIFGRQNGIVLSENYDSIKKKLLLSPIGEMMKKIK
jgi:hypothetical protein